MPWLPELFSTPAVAQLQERLGRDQLEMVPYYAGLLTPAVYLLGERRKLAAARIYEDADPPLGPPT